LPCEIELKKVIDENGAEKYTRLSTRSGKIIHFSRMAYEILDPTIGYIDKSTYSASSCDTIAEIALKKTVTDSDLEDGFLAKEIDSFN
ncbi:MAG: hypothetical protein MHPSP_003360, partial [Paramarteilia canceri]